ncbi:hypothetical protein AB0Y20_01220 [Heyndrickxia oleronia]|uniref:hypothetical protein n=1 Tax=Heyndrickxia oleronia TaxID=38875 RepID=UPI003F249DB8
MYTKQEKLLAIQYFLNGVLNNSFPIQDRKLEMKRIGKNMCKGLPEWSDFFGVKLKPLDNVSYTELIELIEKI